MSAHHLKYFQNLQFKNHGIASTPPPDLPTLKAYPTPGVGGRFGIFSLKWRERMNLKVPGAILPLGCAILSTRAKTVRGVGTTPLRRTRVKIFCVKINFCLYFGPFLNFRDRAHIMTSEWGHTLMVVNYFGIKVDVHSYTLVVNLGLYDLQYW